MKDLSEARTRSVDNLQRLYTIVVSLAVIEGIRQLVTELPSHENVVVYQTPLAFCSLLFTIVPFYHGANRYLDATYVTGERRTKHYALMLDFVALFLEGGILFTLALFIHNVDIFYSMLACLFVFDALWVGTTHMTAADSKSKVPNYKKWAIINIVCAALVFICTWTTLFGWELWRSSAARSIALLVIVIGRTIYDYQSVWSFYYPREAGDKYDGIPAPRPAPPPQSKEVDIQQ